MPSNINLSKNQKQALFLLQKKQPYPHKALRQGGKVVVMDNSQYKTMCMSILLNKEWYCPKDLSVVERFNKKMYTMVESYLEAGAISRDIWEFIRTSHLKSPTFYSLPKLHKNPINPRPIVSGNEGLTENLSQVNDSYLQPHVTSLPSFVNDTIHFLQLIEN